MKEYFMDIIRTVGALVYRDDEVLLVRHGNSAGHATGIYGIPAGKIENEREEIACLRELNEETGLSSSEDSLTKIPREYHARIETKTGLKDFSLVIYLCRRWSGNLRGTDETEPEWVKISDIKRYKLLPNVEQIVHDGMQFR